MNWHCPNCLVDDLAEPFCSGCGAALNVQDINDATDGWSRRAPSRQRVSELIEELGPQGAMTVVGLDAVYDAILGGAA